MLPAQGWGMGAISVIYSNDERVRRILQALLTELSIQAEIATEPDQAVQFLGRQKYDAIFVELDGDSGNEVLRAISRSKHNKRSVTFLVSPDPVPIASAFNLGAHFVIPKPIVLERTKRILKAAHGLMVREQRAHYRHPVATPVSARTEKRAALSATIMDLSQAGALMQCSSPLKKGLGLQLRFVLPDTDTVVETAAKVIWSDTSGRAGVQFEQVTPETSQHLVGWAVARSMDDDPPNEKPAELEAMDPQSTSLCNEAGVAGEVADVGAPVNEPTPIASAQSSPDAPEAQRSHVRILGFEAGRPIILEAICTSLDEAGMCVDLEDDVNLDASVLLQVKLPGSTETGVFHAELCRKSDHQHQFEFVRTTTKIHQRAASKESEALEASSDFL
jgi:CheY-like chemotaxis protein